MAEKEPMMSIELRVSCEEKLGLVTQHGGYSQVSNRAIEFFSSHHVFVKASIL